MELKQQVACFLTAFDACINRTFMELKLVTTNVIDQGAWQY